MAETVLDPSEVATWIAKLPGAHCEALDIGHATEIHLELKREPGVTWTLSTEESMWVAEAPDGSLRFWKTAETPEAAAALSDLVGQELVSLDLGANLSLHLLFSNSWRLRILPADESFDEASWSLSGDGYTRVAWQGRRVLQVSEDAASPIPKDVDLKRAQEALEEEAQSLAWIPWSEGRRLTQVERRTLNGAVAWLAEATASADSLRDALYDIVMLDRRQNNERSYALSTARGAAGLADSTGDKQVVANFLDRLGVVDQELPMESLKKGNADVFVVRAKSGDADLVIEVKGTDWDSVRRDRIRTNVRNHQRQLENYMHVIADYVGAPQPKFNAPGLGGVLLYKARPKAQAVLHEVEVAASDLGVSIVWGDDLFHELATTD